MKWHTYRTLIFAPSFREERGYAFALLEFDIQILGERDRVGVEENAHERQLRESGEIRVNLKQTNEVAGQLVQWNR